MFPLTDFVVENIVSVNIVCWIRRYRSCWSFDLNLLDRVGCRTVRTPLCAVLLSVCCAWGKLIPHLLASVSAEILDVFLWDKLDKLVVPICLLLDSAL